MSTIWVWSYSLGEATFLFLFLIFCEYTTSSNPRSSFPGPKKKRIENSVLDCLTVHTASPKLSPYFSNAHIVAEGRLP